MRRALVILVLVAPLLVPAALGAAPSPMALSGLAKVNGQPAPGAKVEILSGGRVLAQTAANGTGGYALVVPADDPATNAVEGAREGEPLRVAIQGVPVDGLAFAAGTTRSFDADVAMPRLVAVLQAPPPTVREGDKLPLLFDVQNRGNVTAQTPVVTIANGAATVATGVGSDVPPGASRTITVTLNTTGLAGNRTLVATALARNGDAAPGGSHVPFQVSVSAEGAPRVALIVAPQQPSAGDLVRVSVNATDEDGIAYVELRWSVNNATPQSANLTQAPYVANLGPFAANDSVELVVSAADASPAHKIGLAFQTLRVQGSDAPTRSATPTPSGTPAPPAPVTWGVWVILVLVVGAMTIAIYLGRRRARR